MNAAETDFSPLETLERGLRAWWVVVIFVLLGGLAGWGISLTRPPLFESRIVYTFSINFTQTGPLTDVEEDQAIEAVSDVLFSSQVMQQVITAASVQGIPLTLADLQASSTRERTASTWILRVRRPDPAAASTIANLWGEAGSAALAEASRHALTAGGLQRYLDTLESCLSSSAASEPAQVSCSLQNLAQVQQQITDTGQALHREQLASLGMMPGMGYQWTEKAVPAARPAVYSRAALILSGALIGLLLALFTLQSGRPQRLWSRLSHA